jgi:hypothetical protein
LLQQAFFQRGYQRVTPFHDLILHIEDALSPATLLLFQVLYPFPDLVLLLNGRGLPRLRLSTLIICPRPSI